MPKELNLFDTKSHGKIRKFIPSWIRILLNSCCIGVPPLTLATPRKPVIIVVVTIVVVEIEGTGIVSIVVITTATEKRPRAVRVTV